MIFAIDLNPVDDIIDGVGGLIGGAAEAAGEAVLDLVVKFTFGLIADAVASVTGSIVSAMDSTTAVGLNGGFFPALTPICQTVPGMSVALVLALFLVSIIRSPAAGEPGAIIRSALVDVPSAMLLMVMSVAVAWILIRIVDEASLAVTGDVGAAMGEFTASFVVVEALTGAGLLGIIFGLLFVVGAILVWLQLLVRAALIYVLIVLAPLVSPPEHTLAPASELRDSGASSHTERRCARWRGIDGICLRRWRWRSRRRDPELRSGRLFRFSAGRWTSGVAGWVSVRRWLRDVFAPSRRIRRCRPGLRRWCTNGDLANGPIGFRPEAPRL